MRRKNLDNGGISEVFGVMLVLTVTLIVACLVAVFVGGFSFGDEEQGDICKPRRVRVIRG